MHILFPLALPNWDSLTHLLKAIICQPQIWYASPSKYCPLAKPLPLSSKCRKESGLVTFEHFLGYAPINVLPQVPPHGQRWRIWSVWNQLPLPWSEYCAQMPPLGLHLFTLLHVKYWSNPPNLGHIIWQNEIKFPPSARRGVPGAIHW